MMRRTIPLAVRFWAKVDKTPGCWFWTGAKTRDGYGAINVDGRAVRAHRLAYETVIGPIPEGLVIDHACRNRACVNPNHLEPVTARENLLRGEGLPAVRARQVECKNGHPFDEANTRVQQGSRAGTRRCRTCHREAKRRARQASA